MNKEQIIDEAYKNYENKYYKGEAFGYKKLNNLEYSPDLKLLQEEFIDKCKKNPEFSETWGLKIEERELTEKERMVLSGYDYENRGGIGWNILKDKVDMDNLIPRKLITITYNNQTTVESYE